MHSYNSVNFDLWEERFGKQNSARSNSTASTCIHLNVYHLSLVQQTHKMLFLLTALPSGSSGTAPLEYPQNVTLRNYIDYLLAPTLVYRTRYPRVQVIRPLYLLQKAALCLGKQSRFSHLLRMGSGRTSVVYNCRHACGGVHRGCPAHPACVRGTVCATAQAPAPTGFISGRVLTDVPHRTSRPCQPCTSL